MLTPAGAELRPVVEALGQWGLRWMPELGDEDLDPRLLMWDIHRNLDLDALPDGRTVLHFRFTDVDSKAARWWLLVDAEGVDVCDTDPGGLAVLGRQPTRFSCAERCDWSGCPMAAMS